MIVVESSCRLVMTGNWHIADGVPVGSKVRYLSSFFGGNLP